MMLSAKACLSVSYCYFSFERSIAFNNLYTHPTLRNPRSLYTLADMLVAFWFGLCILITQAWSLAIQRSADTSIFQKVVVAHFMVCNTYYYSITDWERDMVLAESKGIDGFALNIGADSWYPSKVADAFAAARNLGSTFKLFISFDMTSFPCSALEHGNVIRDYVNAYYFHSNQLLYNGRPLVSTFAGQHCTFGTGNLGDGWSSVLKRNMRPIHFVPSFFMDPKDFQGLPVMDGAFNWNSGWPPAGEDITFDRDDQYVANLGGRSYMAAMSPWFFTHYGPNSFNKNFIFRSDDWLVAARWESILEHRNSVDLVEIITWNDYGESHYVGPIEGSQPNSESWVNGFKHTAWLDIMQYYITAYKTGRYSIVSIDRIILWARLAPAAANAPDGIGRPDNWQYTQDFLWAFVFLTQPAEITLSCGANSKTTSAFAGVAKLKLPLSQTCNVYSSISRAGLNVVELAPEGFRFRTDPQTYNFNAFVASS